MNLIESLGDVGGLLLGFGLTILVYSYVVRDNPLYRLAVHLLVGVTAGYVAVILVAEVIVPVITTIVEEPLGQEATSWLLPLLLTILLLLKAWPNVAWLGNSAMAVILAIGAGVGLVGAVAGTLIPLTTTGYGGALGLPVAVLTVLALAYFFFTVQGGSQGGSEAPGLLRYVRLAGRFVITVALGGVFAGLLNASLVLLSDRVGYFIDSVSNILGVWLP